MNTHEHDIPLNPARERVLNAAETLFQERGYDAVSLNDLAQALGLRKASLYHYAPGGKEMLYVEVMERSLGRYRAGLEAAVRHENLSFVERLRGAARWLLTQPSLHYGRMMQSDMAAVSRENALRLTRATYQALLAPLETLFAPEMERRLGSSNRVQYLAGAFLAVIESIHDLPEAFGGTAKPEMADFVIEMLFRNFGLPFNEEVR
jgi:AcrR family transcriptional regulator